MQKPICVSRCKITTFPQTRKGIEKILLQRIVFGCFLHELPLMYHELSLIVCFTRITINVPRIVINCFGVLYQGADGYSSHVMPLVFFSLTEKTRTMPKPFGCFGWVRLEIVLGGFSSHVMPAQACALAGIYGCGILESACLNIKTRHCISGCGGAVLSGL